MVFSMMPKPFANQPGSGLHVHVSLWTGDGDAARCVFQPDAGAGDPPGANLSALGRHFIAGVLHHAAALCALAAPTVNSYKRLVVGESLSGTTWAPAYVAHGPNNRTAMVRTLPGRFEWRVPDASANPYLATAALIAAGLDGIDRQLDPGPDCTEDLFALSPAEIRARGIALLAPAIASAMEYEGRLVFELDADGAARGLPRQLKPLERHHRTDPSALVGFVADELGRVAPVQLGDRRLERQRQFRLAEIFVQAGRRHHQHRGRRQNLLELDVGVRGHVNDTTASSLSAMLNTVSTAAVMSISTLRVSSVVSLRPFLMKLNRAPW